MAIPQMVQCIPILILITILHFQMMRNMTRKMRKRKTTTVRMKIMMKRRWYVIELQSRSVANSGQESMSEEQRMEEGRRMFQIFAARMFEQRVLTAYKEKVAKERQQKL